MSIIHIQNRPPKFPEISKSIIEKINVKSDTQPDKVFIAKEFEYKASDGDIVRKKIVDGISIIEIELSENNILNLETLCENNFNTTITTTTRRTIKLEGNLCDVAMITLGYSRKYENELLQLSAKGIRMTHEKDGKTIYNALIKCPPENKDLVLALIRSLKIPMIEQF